MASTPSRSAKKATAKKAAAEAAPATPSARKDAPARTPSLGKGGPTKASSSKTKTSSSKTKTSSSKTKTSSSKAKTPPAKKRAPTESPPIETPARRAPPTSKASAHPVRRIESKDAPLVERLRKICLALPEAGERISHGEPTWFAGKGKVFAMLDNHHHGSAHLSVWLPQPMGAQEVLIEADPARFFRPPYVGPSGWVGVVLDTRPDWSMVADLVREAFVHVATKKLVAQLAASDAPASS